jgi:hypothetical protein
VHEVASCGTVTLRHWEGTLPHSCYFTDSGDSEKTYYDKVLSHMQHPRSSEKLVWTRVADYCHVSERLWTLSELLFGKGITGAAGRLHPITEWISPSRRHREDP